ncbi:MAG: hypothetical protein U5L98_07985 [Halomonas sp.]|nr:hypothetical protein [Halomonas sp.]
MKSGSDADPADQREVLDVGASLHELLEAAVQVADVRPEHSTTSSPLTVSSTDMFPVMPGWFGPCQSLRYFPRVEIYFPELPVSLVPRLRSPVVELYVARLLGNVADVDPA